MHSLTSSSRSRSRLNTALLVCLVLFAAACTVDVDGAQNARTATAPPVSAQPTEPAEPDPVTPEPQQPEPAEPTEQVSEPPSGGGPGVYSHLDVAAARAALEKARSDWAANGPEHYVLRVNEFCECDGFTSESVVLDSVSVGIGEFSTPKRSLADAPRTMDDVFSFVDSIIVPIEDDPSLMPTSDCDGRPFGFQVAPDGHISGASNNTPCDGGATWEIEVTEIPRDGQEPPIDTPSGTRIELGDVTLNSTVVGMVMQGTEDNEIVDTIMIDDPCQLATDRAQCEQEIQAALADAPAYLTQPCENCPAYELRIVVTKLNGPPTVIRGPFQFVRAVEPIDSTAEAALLTQRFGTTVQVAEDEFDHVTSDVLASCDPIVERWSQKRVADGFAVETDVWYQVDWGICI